MSWRVGGLTALLCVFAAMNGVSASLAASPEAEAIDGATARPTAPSVGIPAAASSKRSATVARQKDGTLLIAGRSLRCGANRNVLDRRLPNLGLAAPGVVVFNPRELNRWSDTVRLFVYHHECGHHSVGGDELGADCWAVKEGVRDGWLTDDGLTQVCRSFGGGPATSTHPSGPRRCASLNRCFSTAVAALAKEKANADAKTASATPADSAPKLIQGPILKRSGMFPSPGEK